MTEPAPTVGNASIDRFCVGCGYNLRALSSDRCPECGLKLDQAATAPVPWEGRRHLGVLRAFWRTVLLASFHPKKLAAAAEVPGSDSAARDFARIVAIAAAIPPGVFLVSILAIKGASNLLSFLTPTPRTSWVPDFPQALGPLWEAAILWLAGATCFVGLSIGIWVMFILGYRAVEVSLRFIQRRSPGRERAIAVSRYLCAPLAWLIIPTLLIAGGLATWDPSTQSVTRFGAADNLIACLILMGIFGFSLVNAVRFMSATTRFRWPRVVAGAVGVLLFWIFSAVIGLGIFPVLVGLISLMIDSLRR